LIGKAHFAFVSKYKKGATTPTGETSFQFKVAALNVTSQSYDWLVVSPLRRAPPRIEYQPKDRIPKGEGRFSTIARESRILRKSSEARAGIGPFLARFRPQNA